jgi:hypothetical protein
MTGVGLCGVFIPDRFRQAGRGTNRKVSDRLGVGMLWRGERCMGLVRVGSLYDSRRFGTLYRFHLHRQVDAV